jgi:predicted GNAT family N-acyltransferase
MVKAIKHVSIDIKTLNDIISIKQLSWKYSTSEHLNWINNNIKDNDYHFLLFKSKEIVAYLNLTNITIDNKNSPIPFLGIGNVCTKYKGIGLGKELMTETNVFINSNGFNGLLFCKNHLVDFYKKCNWIHINNLHPNEETNTMIFNYNLDTSFFKYNGKIF